MNKKLLGAAALLVSTPIMAGGYVGGSIGQTSFDYPDVDNATGFRLIGGYAIPGKPISIEATLLNSGDASVDGTDLDINLSGYTATVGYDSGAQNNYNGIGFSARVGLYSMDFEVSGPGGSASESSSGLAWSLGLNGAVAENFILRFDLDGYNSVKDFVDDETVLHISLGAAYHFGGQAKQ